MTAVALVGGGVYAPALCAQLAAALPPGALDLRLAARSPGRLADIAAEARLRVSALRPEVRLTHTTVLREALEGARHVVLLVRVGGLAARAWDETFPRAEQLVGDEGLGPGGFANAWRTLPWLAGFASALRACAPGARVWNLVAPLGLTTRALAEDGLEVLGVCELPAVTRQRWGLGTDELGYAGLNHLGWFWPRTAAARAVLAGSTDIDGPTLARFGAAPLRYYYEIFDAAAAARLGLQRSPGRAGVLANITEEAIEAFRTRPGTWRSPRATPWFEHALVPMLRAWEGGAPWEGYLDVGSRVQGARRPGFAPAGTVVECAGVISGGRLQVRIDEAPAAVSSWLAQVAQAEALAYTAARERDGEALRAALGALPLGLTRAAARRLADQIEAHHPPQGGEGEHP